MLKKTVCVFLLLIFLASPVMVNAGIPVADFVAFAQRIKLLAKEIAKWVLYINRFKEFSKNLGNLKNNFERTIRGFIGDELNQLIGDNIEMTMKVIESVAYEDKDRKDEWTEIFKDYTKLETKYENIKDTEYIKQNKLYQNQNIKNIIDNKIKQKEENLTNIKATIQNMQLIRESEMEMVKKFSNYEKQVETLGSGSYMSVAKITTLMNLMDLDILKLNTNIMALFRMMLENQLKQMAEEEDENQKQARAIQDEVDNLKKIKE